MLLEYHPELKESEDQPHPQSLCCQGLHSSSCSMNDSAFHGETQLASAGMGQLKLKDVEHQIQRYVMWSQG